MQILLEHGANAYQK